MVGDEAGLAFPKISEIFLSIIYNYMKLLVYQIVSTLAGVCGWPLFYHHLRKRGQGESFLPRLGLTPPPPPLPGWPRIWLHGVSVG